MSPCQKGISKALEAQNIKCMKCGELVPNLMDEIKNVLHGENLKYYLRKGLKLKKVYRMIKFQQEAWLSSHVNLCTAKRQRAETAFEKDFWKHLANALC